MLNDTHRKMLEVYSGISPELIEARGYKSVKSDAPELEPFAATQRRDGLLIPGYDVFGNKHPGQIRPDIPRVRERDGKDVILKYESPFGSAAYMDVHPSIRETIVRTNDPFLITEGVKKADCAISHGAPCASLLGVWGWRGRMETAGGATAALKDFDAIPLKGRTVILAFDSDVIQKREVQMALKRFAAYLDRWGADVRMLTWKGAGL